MGLFNAGSSDLSAARKILAQQYRMGKQGLESAGGFAEEQLTPYMLDPSVMQELQGAVTGRSRYQQSPIYQQYMDVGKEAMLEDMAGTGTLYSGKRMEGMRDLGQSAFSAYMQTLSGLAGFGRDTASQMGGIRMNTAGNVAGLGTQYGSDMANMYMANAANKQSMVNAAIGGAGQAAGLMMGA